jgi:serine/threonine protein kinase
VTNLEIAMALGKIAGRYELQEQLGEGGMGVVWRALDTKTGSAVAIKVIRDISDPNAVEMFTKEWRALAELSHPNIVEVRDVDVIEENRHKKPFFVMPLLQGTTLAELIAHSSSRLTVGRIVEITTQVCKGLQAAHQRGLVHRDLKPSNIFVMDDFTAKIIDFGVVYLAGAKSTTGQKGTWQYMSPEQVQLKEITPASDIFSLGVVLYEALTLRRPFARTTVDETTKAICNFIPPPVSEINPAVNEQLSRVVHKCMAKLPMHRFSSAIELADALTRAQRNEPVFDAAKIQPRIERARNAFKMGDDQFASEILAEIEAEGHLDPQITVLRTQIELAAKVRKIRYLLEGARARMEQDEIPLALEKVREVLQLDPGNADALSMRQTMEKQRSEKQIAKWLELAQMHLANRDFGAARHAVAEVLAINRAEPRALDLNEKIDSIEEESKHIRAQKEQLYNSAIRAYQNDEIDTALSKLERLFAVGRSNPEAAVPERDAVYQSFYKEVRSERDSVRSAIEEAQKCFADQQYAEALKICTEGLGRHPGNGAFLALKIQIEDAERQELSEYIADVSRRVETEFDFDRRVNILREACERYPDETQFAQQLKVVRERRDLVNSIVTKARQLEERGQYSEALSQWDMLRNIHPQYPGLAFDLEQCKKKRDLQVVEEERSRAVGEIRRLIETRSFAKAIDRAHTALLEFVGDPELLDLQKSAEQALDRIKESRWLLEEGQRAYQEKDLARAAESLRKGMQLDPRYPALRESLINVLSEWSRSLVETDLPQAESLFQECRALDPTHATVRALNFSISEAKRHTTVTNCLAKARDLAAVGQAQAALDLVKAARANYPNDTRLEQYEAMLLRESKELQGVQGFGKPKAEVIQMPALEPERAAEPKVQLVRPPAGAVAEVAATISQVTDRVPELAKSNHADPAQEQVTKVFVIDESIAKSKPAPRVDLAEIWRTSIKRLNLEHFRHFRFDRLQHFKLDRLKIDRKTLSIGGVVVLTAALAVAGYVIIRRVWPLRTQTQTQTQAPKPATSVHIVTVPANAAIKADSKPLPSGNVVIPGGGAVTLEISRLGYKSKTIRLTQAPQEPIRLEPEPLRLSIQTAVENGVVELDNKRIGELTNGSLDMYEVPADANEHALRVTSGNRKLLITFRAIPGSIPLVASLTAPDYFAFASLGEKAALFGSQSLKNVRLGDNPIADIKLSGTDLPPLTDQIHELTYGSTGEQGSISVGISPVPVLLIHSISPLQQFVITSNVESAVLKVDDQLVKKQLHGWSVSREPGMHRFAMSADGYVTQTWTMSIQPRQTVRKEITLIPVPVIAKSFSVVITNGTPQAEVLLDGNRVGDLDSNGNGRFSAAGSGGHHSIIFQRQGFESRKLEFNAQEGSKEYQIATEDATLAQLATLSFIGTAKDFLVRYRRAGDTWQTVNPPAEVPLPAGNYEVSVEAEGFSPTKSAFTLRAGQVTAINLTASRLRPALEDPNQVTLEGEWFKPNDPNRYVFLKPGALNLNLVFSKSAPSLFGKGKVMWTVASVDGNSEVQYELQDQKLTRRFAQLGRVTDQRNAKVNAASVTQNVSLSVHVQVDHSRVRVTNDRGELLDDYSVVGADLSRGKIGVRTGAFFAVWADIR